jgi:hypothetical protein
MTWGVIRFPSTIVPLLLTRLMLSPVPPYTRVLLAVSASQAEKKASPKCKSSQIP